METRSGERTRGWRCCRGPAGSVTSPLALGARLRRGEAGFSLLESLIALALLGIAFGGIAAGLLTTMRTSADNQENVAANTALSNVAEQMKAMPYAPCATPADVVSSYSTRHPSERMGGQPVSVAVPTVAYWSTSTRTFAAACTAASDAGSQLVRLEVTVGGVTARGSVVLGNRGQP